MLSSTKTLPLKEVAEPTISGGTSLISRPALPSCPWTRPTFLSCPWTRPARGSKWHPAKARRGSRCRLGHFGRGRVFRGRLCVALRFRRELFGDRRRVVSPGGLSPTVVQDDEKHGKDDPDRGDDHRHAREHVARLGAEGAGTADTAERAGEPAPLAALDQDQADHEEADQHDQRVKNRGQDRRHGRCPWRIALPKGVRSCGLGFTALPLAVTLCAALMMPRKSPGLEARAADERAVDVGSRRAVRRRCRPSRFPRIGRRPARRSLRQKFAASQRRMNAWTSWPARGSRSAPCRSPRRARRRARRPPSARARDRRASRRAGR